MKITATQTIKQFNITANQTIRQAVITATSVNKSVVITAAQLGKRGFKGEPGGSYTDIELVVEQDDQTQFNIFSNPTSSNLFINDSIYFKDKSYLIQNISGNWRLIWLNEFPLATSDLLIFRKI